MSLLDLNTDDTLNALPRRIDAPKPVAERKFSTWRAITAPVRGTVEGLGAQILGSTADVLGGFGQVMGAYPEAIGVMPDAAQRKQSDAQRQKLLTDGVDMSSEAGDLFREVGRGYRPDPTTAHAAEELLYQFARGASKVVAGAVAGGLPGVLVAGAEEGMSAADDLKRQGVGLGARTAAGAVQGAGLALAALPAAGQTLRGTLALYAAGGPGGYVAQQALTREILQRGGYNKQAEQFDPFDPVGLAVSALIPAPFAAYGLRANRRAAAEAFRAGPVPSEPTAVAGAVQEAMPRDVVDAAMVAHAAERRAAANLGDEAAAAKHEAALTKAEQQISAGERVQVAEVAPTVKPPTVPTDTPEFRAWFGDSKVVGPEGKPLVVYHGTSADVAQFDAGRLGETTQAGSARGGFFFTNDPRVASTYATAFADRPTRIAREALDAAKASGDQEAIARAQAEFDAADATGRRSRIASGANTIPVHLALRDPLIVDFVGKSYEEGALQDAIARAKTEGHDGVIFRNAMDDPDYRFTSDVFVAFDRRQIKSAIGNSGRFDPNSPSLTDSPYTTWADQITAAIREMQAQARPTDAPTTPQAPNPEAAAPARLPGAAPAAAGAAEPGRPGAAVEAARLTPGDQAEGAAAQTRLAAIQAQYPDLQVMLDGMDKPMPLAEFLAAVKAEADEMLADAPLVELAAQCALVNGQ